ncbi:hypothetical protein MNB_SV-14-1584 [hydrothermal vent metagenome]|uniref:Uncharacterized protein n=1 Tax=hydrothermal vent metagenome TaxID=652676 RepID=A0A1W1CNA2_9ZZZZ
MVSIITETRSSGVPATAVYLVKPSSRAFLAAFLTATGVSKSGSPAEKEITSFPSAFKSLANEEIAMVKEAESVCIRLESMVSPFYVLSMFLTNLNSIQKD